MTEERAFLAASLSLMVRKESPYLLMSYEPQNRGARETAVCDTGAELRRSFGRLLARLWCDTRGRVLPGT